MSVFGYKLKRVWQAGPPGSARTLMKRVWQASRVVVEDGTTYIIEFETDGLLAMLRLLWGVRRALAADDGHACTACGLMAEDHPPPGAKVTMVPSDG